MKLLFTLLALLSTDLAFAGSWYFNVNGGFGIYQPEGWEIKENGRSGLLKGPRSDTHQSEIFLGSDWNSRVVDQISLKAFAETSSSQEANPISAFQLNGFKIGNELDGSFYLLRAPENIIIIEYHIRGSAEQIAEGKTALSSIEIKLKEMETQEP